MDGERPIGLRHQGFDATTASIADDQVSGRALFDCAGPALVRIPNDQPPIGSLVDRARSLPRRISQDVVVRSMPVSCPGAAPVNIANHIVLGNSTHDFRFGQKRKFSDCVIVVCFASDSGPYLSD